MSWRHLQRTPANKISTDTSLGVLQHADVAALVMSPTVALAGPQEDPHLRAMAQLNTPALHPSHTLPTTTKHHPCTLLLSQTKGTTTKATNKIKVILVVNSKVLSYNSRQMPTRRSAVESLSTRLLQVHRQRKKGAMASSDNDGCMQVNTRISLMQSRLCPSEMR